MPSTINFHKWIWLKQVLSVVWILITAVLTVATSKKTDHTPTTGFTAESMAQKDYLARSDCYGALDNARVTTKDMSITYPTNTTFKSLGFPSEFVNIQASAVVSDNVRSCLRQDRSSSDAEYVYKCSEANVLVCTILLTPVD